MPKINHQITRFDKGLSLNIAKEDVADSVAIKNTHNALFDINGNVKGYPVPVNENITLDAENLAIWAGSVNLDGKKRVGFVSYDDPSSTQEFQTYDERIANTAGALVTDKVSITGWDDGVDKITMQERMEHLYFGGGPNHKPKWIGKHKHDQFGTAPPSTLGAEDAALKNPSQITPGGETLPLRYVQQIGSFQYGISADGTTICKFESGVLIKKEAILGQNFTALCQGSTTAQIWVWSEKDKTANLYNGDLDFQANIIVTGLPSDDRNVHDIIWLANRLFFIRSLAAIDTDIVLLNRFYSIAAPIVGGGEAVTNHSHGGLDTGIIAPFPLNDTVRTIALTSPNIESDKKFYYGKRCLFVESGNFSIGVIANIWGDSFYYDEDEELDLIHITPSRYDNYIFTDTNAKSGDVAINVGQNGGSNVIIWLNNSSTSGALLNKNTISIITEVESTLRSEKNYAIYRRTSDLEVWTKSTEDNDSIARIEDILKDVRQYHSLNSHTDLPGAYVSESILSPKATFDGTLRWFFQGETVGKSGSLSEGDIVQMVTVSVSAVNIVEFPGGWTKATQYYYYAFSYLYDGYQESGLSDRFHILTGAVEDKLLQLNIKIKKTGLPRRVSHMNIYRAKGTMGGPTEFFRLVDSVPLDRAYPDTTINEDAAYLVTYNDNIAEIELGPSFEANAGFPEGIDKPEVQYGISAAVEDFMFVGDCYNENIDDAAYMIFRSNAYSYSVFNYETNVLRLPTRPIAMIGYNSRLYIFDEAQTYIINPISMTIEEIIPSAGALNKDCVIATPMGIYVAGLSGIYRITGRQAQLISESIHFPNPNAHVPSGDYGDYFHGALSGTKQALVYEQHDRLIHFMTAVSGNLIGYTYNESSSGWSRRYEAGKVYTAWVALTNTELLGFAGTNIVFFMPKTEGSAYDYATGTAYVLNLKPFDGDDANMDKWFYEVRVDCINDAADAGTVPVLSARNSSGTTTPLTQVGAKDNGTYRYLVPSGFYRRKKIEIIITGNAIIRAVSILYRPKQVRS